MSQTMNPEVKRKWVDALNSGEYEPAIKSLRTQDNRYCCLGVLCDIHAKETGNEWDKEGSFTDYLYLGRDDQLPREVAAWAGIRGECPQVYVPGLREQRLFVLNDKGMPFDQIAALIDAQL